MLNNTRKLILVIFIGIFSFPVFGQNNSSSPFSMFGIGDLYSGLYGRSAAMGGVSTPLISSFQLNPSNPASYSALSPNTFIYEFGLAADYYTIKSYDKSFSKFDANIRSIAMGFPVTKRWKAGFGLVPVSSIGYSIQQEQYFEPDSTRIINTYDGEGGVHSVYLNNSIEIVKSLSLGIKMTYLFGSLDLLRNMYTYNTESTSIMADSEKSKFRAFSFGFGTHYHKSFDKIFLNVGAYYNLNTNLNGKKEKFTTNTISKVATGNYFTDTLIVDSVPQEGKIVIPQSICIGASVIFDQKLEVAVDFQKDTWSKSTFFGENRNLSDNQRFSLGLEYTPDYLSPKFYKVIRYRAGFNYIQSYLTYEGVQLRQTGGSIGAGLPLRSGGIINLAILYNHREVPGNDILKENYIQFNINFSLRSNWFFKPRFD